MPFLGTTYHASSFEYHEYKMKSMAFLFGRQSKKRWTAVERVGVVAVREIGGGGYGRTRDKWISGEGLKVRVGKPL